jgi:Icc-related predicted phosphoesterase
MGMDSGLISGQTYPLQVPDMKLTIISDTHGQQDKLGRLSGEVLIHCGDMFNMFDQNHEEFDRMDAWLGQQDFDLILCVGGNHDFETQKRSAWVDTPFRNAVYLEGSDYVYKGVRFFGAPWIPDLRGQAFFTMEEALPQKWAHIPDNADVVITHTPPAGVLDVSSRGLKLGCPHLRTAINRIQPAIHCFGHVHASSGVHKDGNTTFVNAALVNSQYQLKHPPYEVEL